MLKFRTTKLCKLPDLELTKYSKNNEFYFNKLDKKISSPLACSVKTFPTRYAIESDTQAYMLLYGGFEPIAFIKINTNNESDNLDIELHFDEQYISQKQMQVWVDGIVSSLGFNFFEQRKIRIRLYNSLELPDYQKEKRHGITWYTKNNSYHEYMLELVNELQTLKDALIGQSSFEEQICLSPNISNPISLKEYNDHHVPTNEIFNNADAVILRGLAKDNNPLTATFKRDGSISYHHKTNNNGEFDIIYNTKDDGVDIYARTNHIFTINSNSSNSIITLPNLTISCDKSSSTKTYQSSTSKDKQTKSMMTLKMNSNEEFEYCYIDFNTYKGNHVNGTFMLRIYPNGLRLFYTHRKGLHQNIPLPYKYQELFSSHGQIDVNMLDDLIDSILPIINQYSKKYQFDRPLTLDEIFNNESEIYYQVEQLEEMIELPYLQQLVGNIRNHKKDSKIKKYESKE